MEHKTLKELFDDSVDAIHEKDGLTDGIAADDIPARIRAIQGGSDVSLTSISITAPPNKVNYKTGSLFDSTGMSVWAKFSNGYGLYVNHADLVFDPAGPLEEGTESVTVRFSWSGESAETTQAVNVADYHIYGVKWAGGPSTKWSRTDDAAGFTDPVPYVMGADEYGSPFDGLAPWSGMERVTDAIAGELVAIPKFYFKWTKSGNILALQIADGQPDGFNVSPAHADRGDGSGERDVAYVGRYHCVNGFKSKTGENPLGKVSRADARSGIHDLGVDIWQYDYAMRTTIQMLYLVEFADWNSQMTIGYGCSSTGAIAMNGQTDAMEYHTGTMATNRTSFGFTQYRNIEGLWDNVWDWMDGCYYNGGGLNIISNPAEFSDSSNGILVGKPTAGYPSVIAIPAASGLEWAIYPSASSGSRTTHIPDRWEYGGNTPCLLCGGFYEKTEDNGLFRISANVSTSQYSSIGCRIMKLPHPEEEAM